MKEIFFFSNNKNKIIEISKIFLLTSYKLLSLNDFEKTISPKETGGSFEENANIKSSFSFNKFKKISFADDSGICIEAMSNKPGVNSKEFLSSEKDKLKVFEKIISIVKSNNNFKAYFQTTICLTLSKHNHVFFNGKIDGRISKKILGKNGFGYDPIFIPTGEKQTLGQMSVIKKNQLSHRSIALKKLINYLSKIN